MVDKITRLHVVMYVYKIYLLASSSRTLASNSLLGGYLGKVEGSQGCGLVVKNCEKGSNNINSSFLEILEN